MTRTYDIAVVGLGAVGSAALFHASARSVRTVGFDLLNPPHKMGSSHGGSRIIRRAYFEGAMYVPLLTRSYKLWRELEEKADRPLMHLNGCLTIGRSEARLLEGAYESAAAFGVSCELLDVAEVHRRFPAFQLRDDERALWEPEAGWLDPEECIRAHLDLAGNAGADIRRNDPVLSWGASGTGLHIETEGGTYNVDRIIMCAGGWIKSLLSDMDVPLHIERQVNAWFRPDVADDRFTPERCPVCVWEYAPDDVLYGFPDIGGGVKTGLHHSGDKVDHPDELDRHVHESDVERLRRHTNRLMPHACGNVTATTTCFYTNTPDEHYLIDRHPGLDRVVFASACSGHGFKASSAVGEALVRMALGEKDAVDLSAFRMKRFLRA